LRKLQKELRKKKLEKKKYKHHGRQQKSQARHMDIKGFCSPIDHKNQFLDQEIEDWGQQFWD
jgi:hypothetical protein